MDQGKLSAIKEALETTILRVCEKRLEELTKGNSKEEIAKNLVATLVGYKNLPKGIMPEYNHWDSLYYLLWFQPSHINMAYSLIKRIPQPVNPFVEGNGTLYVRDQGAGQWAMQLALLLVASETTDHGFRVICDSREPSRPMWYRGREIWFDFKHEISKNPELDSVSSVRFSSQQLGTYIPRRGNGVFRLTLLHVAYQESAPKVAKIMSREIRRNKPELIVVTYHPGAVANAPTPGQGIYETVESHIGSNDLEFSGNLDKLTKFRKYMYENFIKNETTVSEADRILAEDFLTRLSTSWAPPNFLARCCLYIRNSHDSGSYQSTEDAPF